MFAQPHTRSVSWHSLTEPAVAGTTDRMLMENFTSMPSVGNTAEGEA